MLKNYFEKRKEKKIKLKALKKEKDIGLFREYFELVAETLVYVFFVMTFLLQSFVIPTGSMIDNLLVGDHLLVGKVSYSDSLGKLDSLVFPQTKIERGMIVTFRAPHEMEKEYVKRVIALPGETVKIVKQQVYINGQPLKEEYKNHFDNKIYYIADGNRIMEELIEGEDGAADTLVKTIISDEEKTRSDEVYKKGSDGKFSFIDKTEQPLGTYNDIHVYSTNDNDLEPTWCRDNFPLDYMTYDVEPMFNIYKSYWSSLINTVEGKVFKVPEGHYFCMGDNRDNSLDSRFWGPVPKNLITGKPWRIYWSFDSTTEEYLTPGLGYKIKDIFKTILNFFPKTRWSRTLKKIE